MLEEQELLKDIEKNRGRHNLISVEDVKNLIQEQDGEKVVKIEEQMTSKSKYDNKRELNNIIKNSQVVIEVLDARDPLNYRSKEMEKKLLLDKEKRLIIILNKTDLVSTINAEHWGKLFRRDIPTLLFSCKAGIKEIDQAFNSLYEIINAVTPKMDKVHVSLCGFPNTGKTSILNLLKKKFYDTCKSKILPCNEIMPTKKIKFFDICGTILSKNEIGPLMPRSCKDVEDIKNPRGVVDLMFEKISSDYLLETYEIPGFETAEEFLTNVAMSKNLKIKVIFQINL
jgi:ribosome biogenesis GTPase A